MRTACALLCFVALGCTRRALDVPFRAADFGAQDFAVADLTVADFAAGDLAIGDFAEPAPQSFISVGVGFACASIGGVTRCWGHGAEGELGNGSTSASSEPVVVSGTSNGGMVAAGNEHACALTAQGGVVCWGANADGELGNGTVADSAVPTSVSGLSSGFTAVSAGGHESSCAIASDGTVQCWGDGLLLGNGLAADDTAVPVLVSGLSGVTALSVGATHVCVVAGGAAMCWGDGVHGELGWVSNESSTVPVGVSGLSSAVAAISTGFSFTCVLTTAGGVVCFGANDSGQLGGGSSGVETLMLTDVVGLSSGATAIATGISHGCALTSIGGVQCWGANDSGQLGNGTTIPSSEPVDVLGLSSIVAISAGGNSTCALDAKNVVACWGANDSGQLGNGTTIDSSAPVTVVGL